MELAAFNGGWSSIAFSKNNLCDLVNSLHVSVKIYNKFRGI